MMTSKNPQVLWFRGLKNQEDQDNFKALLTSSPVVRRLKEIMKEKEETIRRAETTASDYDSPSWAYKQADRNGYMRCLKEVNELFNFIEE